MSVAVSDADLKALLEQQKELEQAGIDEGVARYHKSIAHAVQNQEFSALPPEVSIIRRLCMLTPDQYKENRSPSVADAVHAWKAAKVGRRAAYLDLVDMLPAETLAFIACKITIDKVGEQVAYSKRNTRQAVAHAIGYQIVAEVDRFNFSKAKPGTFKAVKKRLNKIGAKGHYRKYIYGKSMAEMGISCADIDHNSAYKIGLALLSFVVEYSGCVEEVSRRSGGKKYAMRHVVATSEFSELMTRRHKECETLCPYLLPMVVQPLPWTSPTSGGYRFHLKGRLRFMHSTTPRYNETLKQRWDQMQPLVTAINTIQATPWQINSAVFDVVDKLWHVGMAVGDAIPSCERFAEPSRPTGDPTEAEWALYRSLRKEYFNIGIPENSRRIDFAKIRATAERFIGYDRIYFPHFADWRGRLYPATGGTLHPQGSKTAKGLLRFAEGKPLGEHGVYWLKVHLANTAATGKIDKESFDARAEWAEDNEDAILAIADDPIEHDEWSEFDSPLEFLAACFEYAGYKREGAGFISHIPVGMDGCCSGNQHYAALMRHEETAHLVNLCPVDKPFDLYTKVADAVRTQVDRMAAESTDNKQLLIEEGLALIAAGRDIQHDDDGAAGLRENNRDSRSRVFNRLVPLLLQGTDFIDRKLVKRNVMTYCYALSLFGAQDQIMEIVEERTGRSEIPFPPEFGFEVAKFLRDQIYPAVQRNVKSSVTAMDWLKQCAKLVSKMGLPVSWTTPAGLRVTQRYMLSRESRIETLVGGIRIRAQFPEETSRTDARRSTSGIAPNFVHSMDAAHLQNTVTKLARGGVTSVHMIHDSFGTHACNIDQLSATLRETFRDTYADTNLLEAFRAELYAQMVGAGYAKEAEQLPPTPAQGDYDVNTVIEARYFFS